MCESAIFDVRTWRAFPIVLVALGIAPGCGSGGAAPSGPSTPVPQPSVLTPIVPGGGVGEIDFLWMSPSPGETVVTQPCGSFWKLPIQMGLSASNSETLTGANIWVELFDRHGARCAFASGDFYVTPLPAGYTATLPISRFIVWRGDVPEHCPFPTEVVRARATLFSGTGDITKLLHHAVKEVPISYFLAGETEPLPFEAGPCPWGP